LVSITGVAAFPGLVCDDISFFVYKQSLPVVAAHDVKDIIPGIPLRAYIQVCIWILGSLSIRDEAQAPGVPGLGINSVNFLVATCTNLVTSIFSASRSRITRRPWSAFFTWRTLRAFGTGGSSRSDWALHCFWSRTSSQD